MVFRHTLSRRDAILVIMGAAIMHLWGLLTPSHTFDHSIVIDTLYHSPAVDPLPPPIEPVRGNQQHLDIPPTTVTTTAVVTETQTQTSTVAAQSTATAVPSLHLEEGDLPSTSITYHAPGWTLFRDLYMSNGTLYIISSDQSSFPEIRMMTSTGLPAFNTPENVEAREPTVANMAFIAPEEAHRRWGGDALRAEKPRILSVEGNTVSTSASFFTLFSLRSFSRYFSTTQGLNSLTTTITLSQNSGSAHGPSGTAHGPKPLPPQQHHSASPTPPRPQSTAPSSYTPPPISGATTQDSTLTFSVLPSRHYPSRFSKTGKTA